MKIRNYLLVVFVFLFSFKVSSCTCIGVPSISEEVKKSVAIIHGKIIERETISFFVKELGVDFRILKFKVEVVQKFKGKFKKKIVDVYTGVGKGDCGFNFEIGEEYIIYMENKSRYYAKGKKVHKFLYTDICRRTKRVDLEELGEIKKLLAEDSKTKK